MNDSIFRKKSLDRVSSPEQLTDYIKVSSPSVWIVLAAMVILLISVLIWSVFGTIPDTVKLNALVQDGVAGVAFAFVVVTTLISSILGIISRYITTTRI